jgi:DNA-binding CsgD family transcriptional regulator
MHMHQSVPARVWHRTDHYNGIARQMGWNDQLMILAQNRGTMVVVGLYRAEVFNDDERELTLLLQPHLKAAWTRIQHIRPMERQTAPLRIELGANLQPIALTPGQCNVLLAYFPAWRASAILPDPLHRWLIASRRQLAVVPPVAPLRALIVESDRGRLFGRFFPHYTGPGASLLLTEEWRGRQTLAAALSGREREVLSWIARGKRDAEVARILGIATATVSKHVENILRKSGARSRTEALRLLQVVLPI